MDQSSGSSYNFPLPSDFAGDATRAAFPRQLIIYDEKDNTWSPTTDEDILANVEYLAVSYRQSDFPDKKGFERSVQLVCHFHHLNAYWLDYACTGATPEEKNKDLYRIADVFRGAKITLIMIANEDDRPLSSGWLSWGDRIWTLPEALLSPFGSLVYQVGTRFVKPINLRRVANVAYRDREEEMMLIDGYSGKDNLPLTEKVELLRKAIWKRSSGPDKKVSVPGAVMSKGGMFTAYPAERVYALMGFMQYRIMPNQYESEEEAFARLMKANKLEGHRFSWEASAPRSVTPMPESVGSHHDIAGLSDNFHNQYLSPNDALQSQQSPVAQSPPSPATRGSNFDIVIENRRKALRVIANNKPQARADLLCKMAISFKDRFDETHNAKDLDEAIECDEETVQLTPDNHVDKPRFCSNLGLSYQKRYDFSKRAEDLDKAIAYKENAVQLADDNNLNKAGYYSNLGWSLKCRFEKSHNLSDIEQSVAMCKEAVRLSSKDHDDRHRFLTNLATALALRYGKNKSSDDADETIRIRREIIDNAKDEYKKLGYLSQLSIDLHNRYIARKNSSDLDEAIELRTEVVNKTLESDTDKPRYLDNLGLAYRARYDRDKNIEDLDQSIKYREHAIHLLKDGKPKKPQYLNSLAAALTTRFDKLRNMTDIDKAIGYRGDAIRLMPDSDPDKIRYTDYLANDLTKRKKAASS